MLFCLSAHVRLNEIPLAGLSPTLAPPRLCVALLSACARSRLHATLYTAILSRPTNVTNVFPLF